MRIIRITYDNFAEHLDDLVALCDEFLVLVCDQAPRGNDQGRAILQEMIGAAPTTAVLKVEDEDGEAIGVGYYNCGTGYSCGGSYLWLNCIYIRGDYQRMGYGSGLLDHIVGEAKRNGITQIITCRHLGNERSQRLFDRAGFLQEETMLMTQDFD